MVALGRARPMTPAFLLVALIAAAQASGQPSFVPGEVVVRFTAGAGGRNAQFLQAVSRDVGRPLRLARAASGGDMVLALDTPALTARLEKALAAHADVTSAKGVDAAEGAGPRASVSVRLRPGSLAARERAGFDTSTERPALSLTKTLARELDLPLLETPRPEGAVCIEVDLPAATLDLVERLKRRRDVEYAQPNFGVKKLRPGVR